MKIAITDANIFIDLIEIELLNLLFDLRLEIHTTKAVYDQLNDEQKSIAEKFVQSHSLLVYSFSYEELVAISELDFPPALDSADQSVYYYSKKISAMILSGDRRLKTFCETKKIEVRGIIWLFDNFVENEIISKRNAAAKLTLLLGINNRLPVAECEKRIAKWSSE